MASPFSIFRKYQAKLLVVFGVLLMIAFVVLPAVLQMQDTGGGRGGPESVVMTWAGGRLTEDAIVTKGRIRGWAWHFLNRVQEEARQSDPEANVDRVAEMVNQLRDTSPDVVVYTMLLAHKARESGVVVGDGAIYQFLYQVSDNVLGRRDLDTTYQHWAAERRRAGAPVPPLSTIFDALREHLLAHEMDKLARTGLGATTPAEAWEYHNRIHRQVTAEFVPFAVQDFVAEVTQQPSAAEIKTLYDKHKHQVSHPDSPDPGFHRPKKVDFHYFVGELDTFLQEEKANVTRAQIEEYYEERKSNFRIQDDDFGLVDELDDDDPRRAPPRPPQPLESDDEPAVPVEGDEGDSETDAGLNSDGDTPDGCDDGLPAEEPARDSSAKPEDEAPPETEPPMTDLDLPPADSPAADDAATDPSAGGADPARADDGDLDPPGDDKPARYRALEEVEDDIRTAIAGEVALDRLVEVMQKAYKAVQDYEDRRFELIHQRMRPEPFDHFPVAKELGIAAGETGLIDAYSLYEDEELGLARSRRGDQQDSQFFLQIGYSDGLQPYQPIETHLGRGEKMFVTWKVAEREAYVPELKEIRDEVVEAWRLIQARELAEMAAQDLAAKLDGNQPLQPQIPSDREVITPPPFSYVDQISMMLFRFGQRRMPELGVIEGIEDERSDAIKRGVMRMRVGELAVFPNQAKSTYYLVRLAADGDDQEQARESFIQSVVDNPRGEGPPMDALVIGSRDQRERYFQWYQQLEEEYKVRRLNEEFFRRGNRGG